MYVADERNKHDDSDDDNGLSSNPAYLTDIVLFFFRQEYLVL